MGLLFAALKHRRKRRGDVIQTVIRDYFKRISPCVPTKGLVKFIKNNQEKHIRKRKPRRGHTSSKICENAVKSDGVPSYIELESHMA